MATESDFGIKNILKQFKDTDLNNLFTNKAIQVLINRFDSKLGKLLKFINVFEHLNKEYDLKFVNQDAFSLTFKTSDNFATINLYVPKGLFTKEEFIEIVDTLTYEEAVNRSRQETLGQSKKGVGN